MPNVIGVLKQEIDRLAAKQAKSQIARPERLPLNTAMRSPN